jgi:hypothetical protein
MRIDLKQFPTNEKRAMSGRNDRYLIACRHGLATYKHCYMRVLGTTSTGFLDILTPRLHMTYAQGALFSKAVSHSMLQNESKPADMMGFANDLKVYVSEML